jgi:hypothetical protein
MIRIAHRRPPAAVEASEVWCKVSQCAVGSYRSTAIDHQAGMVKPNTTAPRRSLGDLQPHYVNEAVEAATPRTRLRRGRQ